MWDTVRVPGGQQPALWGKPGHQPLAERPLKGEVVDRLGEAQGCCGCVATRHPEKRLCGEAPASCKGLRNSSPPWLALVTQEQVPSPGGNGPGEGLMGGGLEVSFGL